MVPLIWKWIGLFLMKKYLLKYWYSILLLNWIGTIALSQLLNFFQEIWNVASFFGVYFFLGLLFISVNIPLWYVSWYSQILDWIWWINYRTDIWNCWSFTWCFSWTPVSSMRFSYSKFFLYYFGWCPAEPVELTWLVHQK